MAYKKVMKNPSDENHQELKKARYDLLREERRAKRE
jgi:hypothetical protein